MSEQRMDIQSEAGTRVRYAHPEGGYPTAIRHAKKHLVLGLIYTVARTEVHEWHTDVFLEGFIDPFTSCLFDGVDENAVDKIIEIEKKPLPKKLKALIVDTPHAFIVRICTDPKTTQTGIANVICQGIDDESKDYVKRIARALVDRYNESEVDARLAELKPVEKT